MITQLFKSNIIANITLILACCILWFGFYRESRKKNKKDE